MSHELTDDELRIMMRMLSQVVGLPLSEERIEADLPQYKVLLADVAILESVDLPVEIEPPHIFTLPPGRPA
jgi:hypothetical protein